MTVTQWNPEGARELLNDALLHRIASVELEESSLGLSEAEVKTLAPIMHITADDWLAACKKLDAASLVAICKWLTLAEEQLAGWLAGDKSPVIVIAKLLRSRGEYPQTLTVWIKEHSSNRFLPYGSLLDRL